MASKVTKSLPAIFSITSRPLAASRRKPDTVIPPIGNAILTASDKRSGVVGVTVPAVGIRVSIAIAPFVVHTFLAGQNQPRTTEGDFL
jgi:hypothetical protein